MKRGARARGSQPCSREARVTVRAHYGALPFAAGRGGGRRRGNPLDQGAPRPSPPGSTVPSPENAAADVCRKLTLRRGFARCVSRRLRPRSRATSVERCKAMRSPVSRCRKRRSGGRQQRCCALRRSISPHCSRGNQKPTPRSTRERWRAAV